MKERTVIEEMVKLFFNKKHRVRAVYDLTSKKEDAYFRYHNGQYLDEKFIKYKLNKSSMNEIYDLILKEGGNKKCFYISSYERGFFDTKDGLRQAFNNGLGAMIYAGNGIAYFQGEQYIGSPERYILVNKNSLGK